MALPMCDPLAERSTPLSEEASPPATPTRIVLCSLGVAYRAIPAGLPVLLHWSITGRFTEPVTTTIVLMCLLAISAYYTMCMQCMQIVLLTWHSVMSYI